MSDSAAEPAPTDLSADAPAALLLAGAVAAALHVLAALGRALLPAWGPSPALSLVFFLVTLLAFYRHRWTRLYRPYGGRAPIYAAELIVLVLLTRLVPFLAAPGELVARLPGWWAEPGSFFDGRFVLDAVLVGAAWLLGHTLGNTVDQLRLQPGEAPPPRGAPEYEQWERSQATFDHRAAYRQLTTYATGGGVTIILVLALLGQAGLIGGHAPLGEALVAAGLYFVAVLLLLAWAHVTLLDTLWRLEGLTMPPALGRRWPGWLVLILVAVALLALIAPRTYVLDPIALILWLLQALAVIAQLILFLIALPFIWLASLFSGAAPPAPPPAPIGAPPPPPSGAAGGELPLLATLRSLGFWLVTLALAVYAVRTLYSSRWGSLRLLPRFASWVLLTRLWAALLGGLRGQAAALAAALRPGSAARAAVAAALRRPPRSPRPTDPRALIQFLYLSLVERAGRRGYPRRRGMTAAEYSRYLAVRLAESTPAGAGGPPDAAAAHAELDLLTAAFLEARYSRHPVGEPEAGRARRALQRLLALIRGRSRPSA